jgi:hypothetical protein
MSMKGEPHNSRPSTAVTDANTEKAKELLKEDQRLSI